MILKVHFLFIISLLFLIACNDDIQNDNSPNSEDGTTNSDQMNLETMEIGDTYLYSFLEGESYGDEANHEFSYTADTLELEVIDIDGNEVIVRERLLANSAIFQSDIAYLEKDSIYTNTWSFINDTLKILPFEKEYLSSHLFGRLYRNTQLLFPLADFDDEEFEMKAWKTEDSYVGEFRKGYTSDFMLFGKLYERLNVFITNVAMIADGDGHTSLYSRDHGFVRMISYSAWTWRGRGWDKI